MKERLVAGANYIAIFFNDIQQLTHNYAQYVNYLLELEEKYGGNLGNVTVDEKNSLGMLSQTVRYYVNKSYIEYCSIYPAIKEKQEPDLENNISGVLKDYVIKRDILKKVVISMNKVLVNDIIQDLLSKSEDIFQGIYQNETKTTN